jgi:membrane-bound lytic murein transglycosylase D
MSTPRAGVRLAAMLAATALLAACAIHPRKPATVVPHPEPAPPTVAPLPPPAPVAHAWTDLTASFAMNDCNDSPLVKAKLAAYTRSPAQFEQLLQEALPMMLYVQEQLHGAGVPGEFAMLPMLESSYDASETSHGGDPAGMWQLMPHTARRHGLTIDRSYDGRLDPIASTRVAIKMLQAFHQRFGDWRLADLAYNAGSGALANALQGHRDDLGDGAIPDIRISSTSRKHLAKLMALSCIIRDPGRFNVQLPDPVPADRLQVVEVPHGLELRAIAGMANVSESRLRALNPGYLGSRIPEHSPGKLLLPADAAETLAAALAKGAPASIAQAGSHGGEPDSGHDPQPPAETPPPSPGAAAARPQREHVVRKGETLWSIAHRYHVTTAELKRWNHLDGDDIRPGEPLRVGSQP